MAFDHLSFEKFKELAQDQTSSKYEKIGFPNEYRQSFEKAIFSDIRQKLSNLKNKESMVLDIGPGCSDLPQMIIQEATHLEQTLYLVDSKEMLDLLPDQNNIKKIPGCFPNETLDLIQAHQEKFDVLLCYSVFHYIFAEGNIFHFFDCCLSLLAHGGQMLLGDIPNISKRKRFFSSPQGIQFHQNFTKAQEMPSVQFNHLDMKHIDDGVLLGLMMRARNAGFDAYLVPQNPDLPMANRREDLFIIRP